MVCQGQKGDVVRAKGAAGQGGQDEMGRAEGLLKMNFSVGVNMYREKVTCVDQYLCGGAQKEGNGSPHIDISSAGATGTLMQTRTL